MASVSRRPALPQFHRRAQHCLGIIAAPSTASVSSPCPALPRYHRGAQHCLDFITAPA
jgi:hypothetical protein